MNTTGYILAIDPGNIESAWVLLDCNTLQPLKFAKEENYAARKNMFDLIENKQIKHVAIEMVASYGMAVGATVFETCVWIGRFYEIFYQANIPIQFIFRKDEKLNLCQSMRATDATITQALVDRFAMNEPNHGKGTKNSPGWFYGFKKDIWQAYAVGVTFYDLNIAPGA